MTDTSHVGTSRSPSTRQDLPGLQRAQPTGNRQAVACLGSPEALGAWVRADTSPHLLPGRRLALLGSSLLPSALHSWTLPAAPNSCPAGGGLFSVKVLSSGIHSPWPVAA